jgi:hypothetical protein
MKKIIRLFTIITLLVFSFNSALLAQPLPGGGTGTTPPTGDPIAGAPVGDGLLILGILAALYAGKKIYGLYLENKEAAEQEN